MSIEDDESPGANEEHQPCVADDQFDEDLMRDLAERPHQSSDRRLSRAR